MGVTTHERPETATVVASLVRLWERIPRPTRRTVRSLAIASLAANIFIVVTGSVVRLTDSGLGCPTWPDCSSGSLVVRKAMGIHGYIEFGNRMVTFLLTAVALLTMLAVLRYQPLRRSLCWLALALLLGIPAQAVVGGIVVYSHLNPWLVSLHLLLSLAMICVAVTLIRRVDEGDRKAMPSASIPLLWLGRASFAAAWAVLYLGTIVTGSGPNAGSPDSPRTGLSPEAMAQFHADLVFLLVGLTVGTVMALLVAHGPARAQRAARWLLAVELAQGVVGFVQYFTHLPLPLVGVHVLGATVVAAAAAWMLVELRDRGPAPELAVAAAVAAGTAGPVTST